MRRFQRARVMFLKQYVGHYYRDMSGLEGDEPINMIYHAIRCLVPNLIMNNPVTKVETQFVEMKPYAFLLGKALDSLNDRLNLKMVLRRALVESFFAFGIVKTGICASDQLVSFGDIRIDPGQVYADNVDFDDFVMDPSCKTLETAAFTGHRSRVPRQLLLDGKDYDHDIVMKLPRSVHPDAKKKAASMSQGGFSYMEMQELQDYVDIIEMYIPEANTVITIPDPEQLMSDHYIRMQDFYGPKSGPYRYLTLTQPVPGNPFPIAPVSIWYDLHLLSQRLMRKQMERAENQKTLYVVDPSAADQAEDMRDAKDQEVIFGNPESVQMFSSKGSEEGTEHMLAGCQSWFNYMSGNPDQLAGISSNADTATQATILEGNSNVTLEDSRNTTYEFAAGVNSDLAWYLHYDPLIDVPMIVRKREVVQSLNPNAWIDPKEYDYHIQLRLTPEQRRGEHFNFAFKVKARSMTPIDPMVLSKRLVEFATNIVPALTAAAAQAMQMQIPFNLQKAITDMAEQLGLSDQVEEWFNDPGFMQRMQGLMMMGPQPEGKAKGLSLAGVTQNRGMGVVGPQGNPMSTNAQETAGIAQSAMKGSMRGTPGSRGPAVTGV